MSYLVVKLIHIVSATQHRKLMRIWTALGVPAFVLTLALFALMVLRPVLA